MIYLDNMATAPLDPKARAAVDEVLDEGPGNPHATTHAAGWLAAQRVDEARREVAALLGASRAEIVFVSGATEANNLALKGAMEARPGRTIVRSSIEHPCVLAAADALAARGFSVKTAPVRADGIVEPAAIAELIDGDTGLVTVMLANNETGAIQPIAEIASLCREKGALLHCDAAQAAGRIPVDVGRLGVDLLSLSAHKFHGPMGVGALYVREGIALAAQMHGGRQQGDLRAGTVPVPLVHGMGVAARIAAEELESGASRLAAHADSLYERLRRAIPGLGLNGPSGARLPGCLNVSIPGIEAEDVLLACPEIAAATGAACASGDQQPSHVLKAMGASAERIAGALRFSFGRFNEPGDADVAAECLLRALRQVAPQALAADADAASQGGSGEKHSPR